jgi:hypothetical protein
MLLATKILKISGKNRHSYLYMRISANLIYSTYITKYLKCFDFTETLYMTSSLLFGNEVDRKSMASDPLHAYTCLLNMNYTILASLCSDSGPT